MKLDKITQCLLDKYNINEETEQDKAAYAERVKRAQEEEKRKIAIRSRVAPKFLKGDYNK
jgi:hypothetical protein